MQRILDFLKKQKYVIIWTVCYFCVAYALFRILFGFDMLSYAHWTRLANAQLHGFAGFVFGIMILTLLPIYASTTAIIVRTGAPLFTIPLPAFLQRAPAATPDTTDTPTAADDAPAARPLPDGLPMELRAAYLRARNNAGREQISSVDTRSVDTASNIPPAIDTKSAIAEIIAPTTHSVATAQQNTTTENNAFPLPTDFDLGDDFDDTNIDSNIADMDAPVFTEINFDDAPATTPTKNASITEYMHDHNIKIVATDGDILITDKLAIAVHDDPNFWVAEDENWFATGQQKTSPVLELVRAAEKHNVKPVLYMGATNIMDFDQMREKWTAAGITVITRPDELPE